MLAGGTVYYRTRIPIGVAQSSTEAEFCMMVDAGKAAIYIRSILDELQLTQILPTSRPLRRDGPKGATETSGS